MSASPEQEVKPVAPDVEEDEQPVKAATPVAGDNDNDDGEEPEEEEQTKPAQASPAADGDLEENEDKDDDDEVDGGGGSDDESILSEVDEAQFEDFDPENVDVDDRPQLAIDEENLKLVGRHKRKRTEEGADGERASRRKKEGRREKKSRRMKDLEEGGEGEDGEGKSRRREKKKRDATPEDEELLDPETRMFSQCSDTFGWI